MNKKAIIWISTACAALLIVMASVLFYKIHNNKKDAEEAAAGFLSVLKTGDLATLELQYYTYSTVNNQLVADENGVAQVCVVTKQQLADKYGTEIIKAMEDDGEPDMEAELLGAIMKHSTIQTSVKTSIGTTGSMNIQMQVPDIKSWLLGLSEEELEVLSTMTAGHLEDLESRMESGEIEIELVQFQIPMYRQNGKWRFQVTEEKENMFFGGLYNLFDSEEN